jgi:transcriptional regulator with XRE-family HTH domain
MNVREKMKAFRESKGLSKKQMARKCGMSEVLLGIVETAGCTHPNIVSRIQKQYELTDLEAEELLPLHRRPHGGDYDPDRYVPNDFEYQRLPEHENPRWRRY